jgi:hypothetical protein
MSLDGGFGLDGRGARKFPSVSRSTITGSEGKDMRYPFGMMCAFAFLCAGHAWAEDAPSSPRVFDDVLRDFVLSVETASDQERKLHIYHRKSDALLQTIATQECFGDPGFFPLAGDFDFDGRGDFACKSTWYNSERHTTFFLYDAGKKHFAFSFELPGFEIRPDPEARTLTSIDLDDHGLKKQTYRMRGAHPALTELCTARRLIPQEGQEWLFSLDLQDESGRAISLTAYDEIPKSGTPRFVGNVIHDPKEQFILKKGKVEQEGERNIWTLDEYQGDTLRGTFTMTVPKKPGHIDVRYTRALDGQVSILQPDFQCVPVATPDSVLRDFYFEYEGYRDEDVGKNAALRIYRKKTGKLVQTLELAEYFSYSEFDDKLPAGVLNYSWASKLRAGDFNFDGLEDFSVASFCGNANCVVDYYLYDPKRQRFRHGFSLSGYDTNFDPASKTVAISARGNVATHHQTTYRIQGFQLLPQYTCIQSLNPAGPDVGIAVTLSALSGDRTLDLRFEHAEAFSGTVRFSGRDRNASPQCPLRLKDKTVLAYNAKGMARRVAWTLDVECDSKPLGTFSLVLSDTEGEWIQGSYRQLSDGKVIPLKWDYFCTACDAEEGNCE